MKILTGASTIALALLLAGCGDGGSGDLNALAANSSAPLKQIAAPNNGDWSETVSQTPEGGFLMGNPDAPVKLVEYASLTCPHCAAFSNEATNGLRNTYIRSGQVSWEFRNFILNAPDMAMSALARCQQPAAFFRTVEQIFAQQTEILGRIDEQESQRLQSLQPDQLIPPLARAMELDTFFARRGMPEARFNECLSDAQAVQQLTDMTNRAMTEQQVTGTPTFFINGERQDVAEWSALEPRLRAAIGG
ncbi:thioredoxin domain-containing protein [Sphingosinicella sp. LHD-64]|uniref:thioredoxin domain-containing protein n=1 Tax=Sphingosinicella sp. LHD-64 TaxID=3072139 RepID=UPI00280CF1DF|nr:thioredoxin domain-containing protein [Sphingosinicella sp. LHD-64]MDQ8756570.1 thioredoxin domain-containing protein [Sphingosinicella sp. LHD-64]